MTKNRINKNDILKVKVIKAAFKKDSLGKTEDGTEVFIKHGIVEDIVTAKVEHSGQNGIWCSIIEIIKPSPYRIESLCKISNKCGNCAWINIDSQYQLELRKNLKKEALKTKLYSSKDLEEMNRVIKKLSKEIVALQKKKKKAEAVAKKKKTKAIKKRTAKKTVKKKKK